LIFLGCVIFVSLAAAPYTALHAEHVCTHDGLCPGCIQLHGALDLLKQLNTAVVRISFTTGSFGIAAASGKIPDFRAVPASSVSLKVRMNT
jgi:hypothetical protein